MANDRHRTALVIDDEASIRRLVDIALSESGFDTSGVAGASEALDALRAGSYDLVVLDLLLPDGDGLDFLPKIRELTRGLVVVLSARHDPAVVREAIALGADDYIAKPFDPEVLARRVEALSAKVDGYAGTIVAIGRLRFNADLGVLTGDGSPVTLGETEARLLQVLARGSDGPLSGDDILAEVWGPDFRGQHAYLQTWIARLRRVLDAEAGRPTIRASGAGYELIID